MESEKSAEKKSQKRKKNPFVKGDIIVLRTEAHNPNNTFQVLI
jgi:hypothetical protein